MAWKALLLAAPVFALPAALVGQPANTSLPESANNIPSDRPQMRNNAAAGFMEQRYALSGAQAEERAARIRQAEILSTDLSERYPDRFEQIIIDHEPMFRIHVIYTGDPLDDEVRKAVDPQLRPLLQFKRSSRSRAEIASAQDRIIAALGATDYVLSYDHLQSRFDIRVDRDLVAKIQAGLPSDVRGMVSIVPGGRPSRMQANASSADSIYGGWELYDAAQPSSYCTAGFVTQDGTGAQGILTANHCFTKQSPSDGRIFNTNTNDQNAGKVITLNKNVASGYYRQGTDSSKLRGYDFRMLPIPVTNSPPSVWFWNPKVIRYTSYVHSTNDVNDELQDGWARTEVSFTQTAQNVPPQDGWFDVAGVLTNTASSGSSNPSHLVGSMRCKSGHTTGITCGTISSASARVQSEGAVLDGVVIVANTPGRVIGGPGDSGAPVTDGPYWDSGTATWKARAAGLLVGGSDFAVHPFSASLGRRPCDRQTDGANCDFYYMPIDRINDFATAKVKVRPQATVQFVAP